LVTVSQVLILNLKEVTELLGKKHTGLRKKGEDKKGHCQ
jgi:hypothetical protein